MYIYRLMCNINNSKNKLENRNVIIMVWDKGMLFVQDIRSINIDVLTLPLPISHLGEN